MHVYYVYVCMYIYELPHIFLQICMFLYVCMFLGKLSLHNIYISLYVSYGNCGAVLETVAW